MDDVGGCAVAHGWVKRLKALNIDSGACNKCRKNNEQSHKRVRSCGTAEDVQTGLIEACQERNERPRKKTNQVAAANDCITEP